MEKGFIKSYDGTNLAYYLVESESPKYVVQIAHGMQEYSSTYFDFAEYLAKHNCTVFMFDERGHGKTSPNESELGLTHGDIFEQTVNDHIFISKMLKERFNLPLILFGHSYGSFVAQKYILNTNLAEKVILSGSAYMKLPKIRLGKLLANFLGKIYGLDKRAKLLERMTLEAYALRFKKRDGCWITSDESETEKFYADKLNATPFSIGFYKYMFTNQLKLYDKKALLNANSHCKILIVSGDKDPVGESGRLPKKLFKSYLKYGFDVKLKLYNGLRHGIVQEKEKLTVYNDILNFINE